MKLRISGIDPSLSSTGIATHSDGTFVVRFGKRPERIGDGDEWMRRRVLLIRSEVLKACALDDLVVIEGFSYGSRQGRETLGFLGHSIREALSTVNVPYIDIAPKSLKKFATGNGNASKEDVKSAAVTLLGLDPKAKDDEADALWLREIGRHLTGSSSRLPPISHTEHLKKIPMPEGF